MRRSNYLHAVVLVAFVVVTTSGGLADEPAWREVGVVEPFPGPVRQYALSSDGSRAATVGNDGHLALWDTKTRKRIVTVRDGSRGWDGMLAFSPDGTLLASQVPAYAKKDPFAPGLVVLDARTGNRLTGWRETVLAEVTEHMPARLFHHGSGAVVFDPGAWGREILVSSDVRLRQPDAPPRREWQISPYGTTVFLLKGAGVVGGRVPSGSRRDSMTLKAYAVKDGALRYSARVESRDVPQSEPHIRDVCALADDEVAFATNGRVDVFSLPDKQRLYSYGSRVFTIARRGPLWITGHGDGHVEVRRRDELLRRIDVGGGIVRSIRQSDRGFVVRTQEGHVAVVDDEVVHRAEGSIEAQAHGSTFTFRWGDGRTVVKRLGEELWTIEADRPEYDEEDSRNKPVVMGGPRLGVLESGRLVLYDIGSRARLGDLGGHAGRVTHLAWRGDRVFARGGTQGYYVAPLHAALIDPKTARITARAEAGAVYATPDALTKLEMREFKKHGDLVVAPKAERSAQWRGTEVHVFDGIGGSRRHRFPAEHNRHGVRLAFSPDAGRLAAAWVGRRPGVLDVRVRVWDLETGRVQFEKVYPREAYPARDVEFSPDGRWLVAHLRSIRVFDTAGVEVHDTVAGPTNVGRAWAFTPDSTTFVAASHAGPVEVFDLGQRAVARRFDMPRETYSHFVRLTMSPTGSSYVLYYSERDLAYWIDLAQGPETMRRIETWARHGDQGPLAFFPSGDLAVFTHAGLEIGDAKTRVRTSLLEGVGGAIVGPSPDGRSLAIAQNAAIRFYALTR